MSGQVPPSPEANDGCDVTNGRLRRPGRASPCPRSRRRRYAAVEAKRARAVSVDSSVAEQRPSLG